MLQWPYYQAIVFFFNEMALGMRPMRRDACLPPSRLERSKLESANNIILNVPNIRSRPRVIRQ